MLSHILSTCFRTASHRSSIYKNYIVLAIGILFFLSGCEIKSAQVERMEKLASIMQLATGREVGRRLQNAEPGLTGPTIAQILIEYEPINNYTKKDVYNEIVAILKKNY